MFERLPVALQLGLAILCMWVVVLSLFHAF